MGDFCDEDETIATVDTDKVSIEVKSPVPGELKEALVEEGDEIQVGQVIARIIKGKPRVQPEEQQRKHLLESTQP